ncbi:hypothetical protein [Proteus mirabilis]|uniref:hypothetical protein n=1 Tax=Proteus mirabilis TaxID=584 RepID=UPI0016501AC4|nr:hypothetical protein [Proteus mirabilis]MBC6385841.1 hypothetical protein [Proteus mirabilis]MBS3866917.1 hypothetical protein [Proteus mirabilis]
MTVSTELSHEEYVGNGVTTDFDFRFRIFEGKHLIVVVADSDGNEKTLKNGTDYTIVGAGSYHGGKVVLNKPLAQGWKILLERDLPVVQETDLRNQGKFFAEVHEDAFDYLTMLIQKALGTFSLSLRKPTYLSNYYDAKGNRIANLASPKLGADAVNKDYVDNSIKDIDSKTLRVKDKPINALPNTEQRANKILAFDDNGQPITVLPESGSASDVLIELGKPTGASMIGVQPNGNLQQMLNFVTPEQFGAIGDGVYHPLSERFDSLSEAQETYPHVTSLDQSIDWAACQAADNYARGKCPVRCPYYANYHFGSTNYLSLGINSKWYGSDGTMVDTGRTTITKTNQDNINFGLDSIVRVMEAEVAGSDDQFVRGVVFKGFRLQRESERFSVTKRTGRIGFHLFNAIKAEIDITVSGNEYGILGYVTWGNKITVRGDSNHKLVYLDAVSSSPEYTPRDGEAVTSCDIRIEADAGPFGIVLRKCKYTRIHGFVEGALVNERFKNYDYMNETAVAVTLIDCDSIDISQLGIEAWQGVHLYASRTTVTMCESWTQDGILLNTTGNHGAFQAMAEMTGATELSVLPETNKSYFYSLNSSCVTVKNFTCDMSGDNFSSTFLCSTDNKNSKILFENTKIYFGSSRKLHPNNGYWSNIESINDPYLPSYLIPSGYTYLGKGKCIGLDYISTQLNSDGTATVMPPDGWKIISAESYLVTDSASQASLGAVTIKSKAPNGVSITFQAGQSSSAYSLYTRLTLLIIK